MKKIVIIILLFFVYGCGFKSIYDQSAHNGKFNVFDSHIVINHNGNFNTRSVEAKYINRLYKELRMEKNVNADNYQYLVEIYLDWYKVGSLRKGSGSLSRNNVIFKAHYQIKDPDGSIVYKGEIKTIDSVDVSDSRFTTHSMENYTIDNLVISSVDDLKNKLISLDVGYQ